MRNFINRKVTAWIAMFAILCQALMPSIAQARSGVTQDSLIEICTSVGLKEVALDDRESARSSLEKLHAPHCAFCLPGTTSALPLFHAPVIAAIDAGTAMASPVSTPRVKSRRFAAALSRGPPSLS